MNEVQGFNWDDCYLLGYQPIDDTHKEFVELLDALLTAPDAALVDALAAFAAHAQAHFNQENRMMEETEFPPRGCHKDEHDKVLASVIEVQALTAAGNTAVVRDLALALKDWFPAHADYMDSALAKWMVKRVHGASPFVFRRKAAGD